MHWKMGSWHAPADEPALVSTIALAFHPVVRPSSPAETETDAATEESLVLAPWSVLSRRYQRPQNNP